MAGKRKSDNEDGPETSKKAKTGGKGKEDNAASPWTAEQDGFPKAIVKAKGMKTWADLAKEYNKEYLGRQRKPDALRKRFRKIQAESDAESSDDGLADIQRQKLMKAIQDAEEPNEIDVIIWRFKALGGKSKLSEEALQKLVKGFKKTSLASIESSDDASTLNGDTDKGQTEEEPGTSHDEADEALAKEQKNKGKGKKRADAKEQRESSEKQKENEKDDKQDVDAETSGDDKSQPDDNAETEGEGNEINGEASESEEDANQADEGGEPQDNGNDHGDTTPSDDNPAEQQGAPIDNTDSAEGLESGNKEDLADKQKASDKQVPAGVQPSEKPTGGSVFGGPVNNGKALDDASPGNKSEKDEQNEAGDETHEEEEDISIGADKNSEKGGDDDSTEASEKSDKDDDDAPKKQKGKSVKANKTSSKKPAGKTVDKKKATPPKKQDGTAQKPDDEEAAPTAPRRRGRPKGTVTKKGGKNGGK